MSSKSVLGLKPSVVRWARMSVPALVRGDHSDQEVGAWERIPDGLRVMESFESHCDEDWLHVSVSFPNRLPSWADMREVKETFCGKERESYMVLPPEKQYVNDHPFVLHLWCAIDGPVLPDFRRMGPFGKMTL